MRHFELPLVVILVKAILACLVRAEQANPPRVARIEFQACPVTVPDCNLMRFPQLHKFLKLVIENGDYPGVTVKYIPGMIHPQVIMVDEYGRELDYHTIGKLSFAELNTLVRSRGFRRNGEETITAAPSIDAVSLHTTQGSIRIKLRPEWSIESVEWIRRLAVRPELCKVCEFYRAEPGFLLQGVLEAHVPSNNVTREGPKLMERGEVGWAGGEPGPHFFIYLGSDPAKHWGLTHTVWGVIADEDSMAVVEKIVMLPAESSEPGGMKMMVKREQLTIDLAKQDIPDLQKW